MGRTPRPGPAGVAAGAILLAISLAQPSGAAGAPPAGRGPRPATPVVVDGAGRVVGRVVGSLAAVLVVVELVLAGRTVLVETDAQGIVEASHVIVYEASDCSGVPYIGHRGDPSLYDPVGLGPGHIAYGTSGPTVTRTIQSQWDHPTGSCTAVLANDLSVYPAVDLADLDNLDPPLTPPLRVQP